MTGESTGLVMSIDNVFTGEELAAIEQLGDGMAPLAASLGGGREGKCTAKVAALDHTEQTRWIYERVAGAVAQLNQNFRFNLTTFRELFQFLVYRGEAGSHFDWHMDHGPAVQRKLSLTLQLSDPAHYQGCDLQFNNGKEDWSAPRARGSLIAYPAQVLHRVTPITWGTRKALVAWVGDT